MKLLDIFITKDGEKVQPEVPVSVEIKLLDKSEAVTALNQEASDTELEETKDDEVTNTNDPDISMQIIHFAAEGPESLECVNKEETVKFKTSGFSIYAIIGTETGDPSETQSVKFEFYYGAAEDVQEYEFVNQDGETTNVQYVTGSEYLQNPGLPAYNGDDSDVAQAFLGWCYAVVGLDGAVTIPEDEDGEPIAYDFGKTLAENIAAFTAAGIDLESLEADEYGDYTIQLLGIYNDAVYVYYYTEGAQKEGSTGYDIHAISLIGEDGTEDFTEVDYVPDSSSQAFLGWSTYTPAEQREYLGTDTYKKFVLNHTGNIYGEIITGLTHSDDGSIAICGGIDTKDSIISLYPVVADVYWVTYDKNDWIYTYDSKDGAYNVKTATSNPGSGMYSYDATNEVYMYANGTGDWDLTFEYIGTQQGHYSRAGSGATYVAPVYVLEGESLASSDNEGLPNPAPTWDGYVFEGWYPVEDLSGDAFSADTVISNVYTQYNGGNEDDHSLTLYAKWTPEATTYTVAIWLENADDDEYSYVTSYTLTGTTLTSTAAGSFITNGGTYYTKADDGTVSVEGTFANRTALLQTVFGSETIRYNNTNHTYYEYTYYDYENPRYSEATIDGTGSTVVNVYYDRNEYTVRFYYGWATTSGGTPVYERTNIGTANNGTITGVTGTQGNYYYSTETGDTRVYWRNGYFRSQDRNNGQRYTGAVWERIQTGTSGGTQTYYISTTNTNYNDFGSTSNRATTTKDELESVNGYSTTTVGSNTVYYFDLTAKYGANLTDSWPTKILTASGEELDTGDYSFISWLTDADSVYRAVASSNANIKGTFATMSKALVTKTDGTATTAADGGVAHIAHGRFDDEYYNYQYYYYLWDPNTTSNTTQYTATQITGFTSANKYPSGLNAAPSLPDDLEHFDTYLYKDTERNSSTAYSGDWTTYVVNTRSAGYVQQQALMEVAGYTRVAYTGYLGSGGANDGTGASNTDHSEGHMYFYFWPSLNELNFMDGGTVVSNTNAYYTEDISDNSSRSTVADTLTAAYMNSTYGSSHAGYEFVGWFADSGCGTYVFFHDPTAGEVTALLDTMVDREETSRYTELTEEQYNALSETEKTFIYSNSGKYYQLNYVTYSSMPDSGLTLYAGWRILKYRVWIQPNGGQLTPGSMATYFNNTYQQLVGKYEGVQRNFVPAVSTTPETEQRFAYVYISSADYKGARIALYVFKGDDDKYYYYDTAENTADSVGSNPIELSEAYVAAAQATGQLDDDDFKYIYKYNGYALVGWYQYLGPETVQGTENGSSAPTILTSDSLTQWNFGEGTTDNTAIRAIWKRTGYLTVAYQATGYQLNSDGTLTVGSCRNQTSIGCVTR